MTHVGLLQSKCFVVSRVELDSERGLLALGNKFPGNDIDVVGAGDHLPNINAVIRRVKEICRNINASLPFKLPKIKANILVTYVVNQKYTRRTRVLNDNMCPREWFTGRNGPQIKALNRIRGLL